MGRPYIASRVSGERALLADEVQAVNELRTALRLWRQVTRVDATRGREIAAACAQVEAARKTLDDVLLGDG